MSLNLEFLLFEDDQGNYMNIDQYLGINVEFTISMYIITN